MSKIDIETVMDDVQGYFESNIQTIIDAINTEKGDSLVPDFIPDSYFLYHGADLSATPPYGIFHIQYLEPQADIEENQIVNSLRYNIVLTTFISNTLNDNNDYRIGLRYSRVLYEIYKKLSEKLTQTELMGQEIAIIPDSETNFTCVTLTFKVAVTY